METAQAPPTSTPKPTPDRSRILDFLIGLFVIAAVVIAALPFVALGRGAVVAIGHGFQGRETLGVGMSLVALGFGALFFVYSVKYYLATVAMLISSLLLSRGNGHPNGNGHTSGNGHPQGLMRFLRRRNGNGHPNGNGNGKGNGHFNLGYEPFVSIHIATYNEKRVIGRLLEGCAALEYGNYEVIVVDDSTDETTQILEAWKGRPGFKLVHRTNRDGFKGGALSIALLHTDPRAQFVIVWDADVVPFPDSIQTYLPHFFKSDGNGHQPEATPQPRPDVAAVQSYQWHVLNKSESWLTEAVRAEYAGSYMVERPFQEFMGSLKMVAGTAFMIRADLLRELGWGRSLTEDWELTLRLYARGYKVVYTPYAESPAECVATFGRLARQRMRWAEGHTYNVRRWFTEILGSRRIGLVEKVGFLFYSTYYLQAALFLVGSTAWLVAEIGLHAHIPEWTATLGWSLLLSNLISLPLMNFAGLLLEGAPAKDFVGVLGALATSFLLVPFQAYAALKGLLEKDEGPWYRTPKTGRVTDPVQRLRRLKWLRRWLGPLERRSRVAEPSYASARPPARPARRLAWIVVAALSLALTGIGYGALHAPIANAAGTTFYMHDPANGNMDATVPAPGAPKTFSMTAANDTFTWSTPSATLASQTIDSSTTFQFNYWTAGLAGATSTANLTFGYSANPGCVGPVAWIQNTTNVGNGTTLTATLPNAVAAGDLLVGIFRGTTAPPTVTDNINGDWTQAGIDSLVSMWYVQNTKAAAAGALTVTLNSAATGEIRMSVDEFSGVAAAAALDNTSGGTSTTQAWTAAAIPATAGELVYAGIGTPANTETATAGTTNGAAMTIGGQRTSGGNGTIASEYRLSSVAGVQNSSLTLSAPLNPPGTYTGMQGTFKAAAGGVTSIATSTGAVLGVGNNQFTPTWSPAASVLVPAGSYFCYSVRVTSVTNGGLTLNVDAATTATALISSQAIFIPELVLPFIGLAVLAPLAARLRRRRPGRDIDS